MDQHKHVFGLPPNLDAEKMKRLPQKRLCKICKQMIPLDPVEDVDKEGYSRVANGRMRAKKPNQDTPNAQLP